MSQNKSIKQKPSKNARPNKQQKPKKARLPGEPRTVRAPAAQSTAFKANPPRITNNGKTCRVQHRELIASVTGSTAFAVGSSFELNPGVPQTFPWLSVMAQAWEQYEFHALKFHFVTRTGTNVPGSCMIVPDFDAADDAPVDEATASSYQSAVEDAPWRDIVCVLPKASMSAGRAKHFVRQVALAANLDIKTYDVGKLFVLTVDGTAVNWGKLWVEYDISFYVPQLPSAGIGCFGGGIASTGASETAANPFGTAPAVDAQAKGISMSAASVLMIQQVGDYQITLDVTGTGISAFTAPVFGAGIALAGASAIYSAINAGATNAITRYAVRVSANSVLAPATIAFAMTATTVTLSNVVVAGIPAGSAIY